jgi:aspartyl protease family protein
MALSSGGRRLITEALGLVAVLAVGAVAFANFKTVTGYARQAVGLPQDGALVRTAGKQGGRIDPGEAPVKGGTVELRASGNGHFFTEAEINGRPVNLMVDTGATMVALTYDDAVRAGVEPRERDFTQRVSTANGTARVAPVVLDRISIGNIQVRNVQAAIAEPGKLRTTLLGMSFLGRLNRVDMRSGRLILEE